MPTVRRGPKHKPPDELRVLVAVRLPPAAAEQLRAVALATRRSQSDVISAALERYAAEECSQ